MPGRASLGTESRIELHWATGWAAMRLWVASEWPSGVAERLRRQEQVERGKAGRAGERREGMQRRPHAGALVCARHLRRRTVTLEGDEGEHGVSDWPAMAEQRARPGTQVLNTSDSGAVRPAQGNARHHTVRQAQR